MSGQLWLSPWMKATVAISMLRGFFLVGLVVLAFLPETKGQHLPE